VWVVLHSGSRGVGNQLARAHIATAKRLARELELRWAQDDALANRDQMMDAAMTAVLAAIGFGRETRRINCHHNFTELEVHGGRSLWINYKGV
jgi:tRNA-splicing ligase RtcB